MDGTDRPMTWDELARERTTLLAEIERLQTELTDGDYWMERAKHYLEAGNCPICFASDESGHERGCCWGQAESQLAEHVEEIRWLRVELAARPELRPGELGRVLADRYMDAASAAERGKG